jgi:hypothetical protein
MAHTIADQRVLLELFAQFNSRHLPTEEPMHTLGIIWVISKAVLMLGVIVIALRRAATRYFGLEDQEDQDKPRRSGPRRLSTTVRRRRRSKANHRKPVSRSRR